MSSVGCFTTNLSLTLNPGQTQPLKSTKVNQYWYTNCWNKSVWSKPNISNFWKNITSRCLSNIYQKTLNLLHWGAVLGIFLWGSSHGQWLFLNPARMGCCGKGRSQIQVQLIFASPWNTFILANTQIWERTTCPPADFMLNKHIHEIRFPANYEENYESLH